MTTTLATTEPTAPAKTLLHYSVPGLRSYEGQTADLEDARAMASKMAVQTMSPAVILVHSAVDGREVIELFEIVTMKR